ncbi:MAG: nuclease-related domain-containing protein [Acidimicrobiia bacterium]
MDKPGRFLTLQRADTCTRCGSATAIGERAFWEPARRAVTCLACCAERSEPGASAAARADHLRAGEATDAAAAWDKGAVGERLLGNALSALARAHAGVFVLHDLRIRRSSANIDHVAVTPEGVFVIDAEHWDGTIEMRVDRTDAGVRARLFVGGRDRTRAIDGMTRQVAEIRDVLGHATRVFPVICFVHGDWAGWSNHFTIDGVLVSAWDPLRDRLAAASPDDWAHAAAAAALLGRALGPAVTVG